MTTEQADKLLRTKIPIISDESGLSCYLRQDMAMVAELDGIFWASTAKVMVEFFMSISERLYGKVLVVGYGIGTLVHLLEQNERVTEIVIVDNEPRLRPLMPKYQVETKVSMIKFGDIRLVELPQNFDSAFIDIWDNTIDSDATIADRCRETKPLIKGCEVLAFPEEWDRWQK